MGLGARELWGLYEPIHGVLYFTEECRAAADDAVYQGFWMGYFAMRDAYRARITRSVGHRRTGRGTYRASCGRRRCAVPRVGSRR